MIRKIVICLLCLSSVISSFADDLTGTEIDVTFRGSWQSNEVYVVNDVVFDHHQIYVKLCDDHPRNIPPVLSSNWYVIVSIEHHPEYILHFPSERPSERTECKGKKLEHSPAIRNWIIGAYIVIIYVLCVLILGVIGHFDLEKRG